MSNWPVRRIVLAAILLAAAALRFTGLGWGLRHTPHMDERYFVDNVLLMLSRGDLDHRYYEYPGLFFYLLMPAVAVAGKLGLSPYLGARALVAAFGVVNVALLYRLGARLAGPVAALVAAGFLACSRVDVQTGHMVRPDIVLATLVLLALAAFRDVGEEPVADARSGLAVGAAVALKFTGLFLAPAYLVQRLLAPGRRVRGGLLAAAVAVAAFALLSPYAILHARQFYEGAHTQVTYHYQQQPRGRSAPLEMFLAYAGVWPKALGVPGALLAALGLVAVRREWRSWAPLLLVPLTTLSVLATQEYRFDRHMIPSFGVVALLAGVAVERLWHRRPAPAAALALMALAFPLASSIAYVEAACTPLAKDVALDWIVAHVPRGARVVTTVEGLGLDRERLEVIERRRLQRSSLRQAFDADVVVTSGPGEERLLKEVPPAFVARPGNPLDERPVRVRLISRELRPPYVRVALAAARLRASQRAGALDALRDGRLDTRWEIAPRRKREDWVEVRLPEAVRLARIELTLGDRPDTAARGLRLSVSEDGVGWVRVRGWPGRPPVEGQVGPPSQVLLLEPIRVRGLRMILTGRSPRPWGIAELRLDALADGG